MSRLEQQDGQHAADSAEEPSRPSWRELSRVRGRFRALDCMRFVAVTLMVQGHTFTALLEESVRGTTLYRQHAYVHGFTAPLFFFSSFNTSRISVIY